MYIFAFALSPHSVWKKIENEEEMEGNWMEWNGMEEQVPIMFLDLSLFSLFWSFVYSDGVQINAFPFYLAKNMWIIFWVRST